MPTQYVQADINNLRQIKKEKKPYIIVIIIAHTIIYNLKSLVIKNFEQQSLFIELLYFNK